jgi:septin family protein
MKKELEKVKESREKKIGKSLIVVGPTGIAKTAYLLVYLGQELGLKVLKVNNLDGLRYYKGEGAIVYDDISRSEVEYLTREQIIALMDSENSSTVSIKHGSIEIPENIQKIWIANIDPYFMNDSFKDGAVVRRVLKVILENKSLIKPIEDNKEKE